MNKIVDDFIKYDLMSKEEKERMKKAIDDLDLHLRKRIKESQKSFVVATVFSPSWIDFCSCFKNIDKPVFDYEGCIKIESEDQNVRTKNK